MADIMIAVLAGTTRKQRKSIHAAKLVAEVGATFEGVEIVFVDPKDFHFAGASSGQWGGVRAIEALVGTVREMGLVATFTDMQFPKIQELFDENGTLQNEAYREYVKEAWIELIWMTKTLKWGRENIASKHHQ